MDEVDVDEAVGVVAEVVAMGTGGDSLLDLQELAEELLGGE